MFRVSKSCSILRSKLKRKTCKILVYGVFCWCGILVLFKYPSTTGFRWGHLKNGPYTHTVSGGNGRVFYNLASIFRVNFKNLWLRLLTVFWPLGFWWTKTKNIIPSHTLNHNRVFFSSFVSYAKSWNFCPEWMMYCVRHLDLIPRHSETVVIHS